MAVFIPNEPQNGETVDADILRDKFNYLEDKPETEADFHASEAATLEPGDKAKLDSRAPRANPAFTGTVTGITKAMVGLNNVPNLDATNAGNISTGTLDDARLSATVTRQGNAFNGARQLLQLDGTGKLPAVDGSQLTNLPASGGGGGSVAHCAVTNRTVSSGTNSEVLRYPSPPAGIYRMEYVLIPTAGNQQHSLRLDWQDSRHRNLSGFFPLPLLPLSPPVLALYTQGTAVPNMAQGTFIFTTDGGADVVLWYRYDFDILQSGTADVHATLTKLA